MAQQSTVLEFTCLWTLNKTQKRKNWRDGTIRFHQFNKRAMVYDDHRRLIVRITSESRKSNKSRTTFSCHIQTFHPETNSSLRGYWSRLRMVQRLSRYANIGSARNGNSKSHSTIPTKEQQPNFRQPDSIIPDICFGELIC
jgi:hypothetical protein